MHAHGMIDFFFQAEDGIRDYKVTGVQTCALPISRSTPLRKRCRPGSRSATPWRAKRSIQWSTGTDSSLTERRGREAVASWGEWGGRGTGPGGGTATPTWGPAWSAAVFAEGETPD